MIETDWLCCTDPLAILVYAGKKGNASARKLRLFACACCRKIWKMLPCDSNRELVEAVEKWTEGDCDDPPLREALTSSTRSEMQAGDYEGYWAIKYLGRSFYKVTPVDAAIQVIFRVTRGCGVERASLAALGLDIFNNPFHPPPAVMHSLLTWRNGLIPLLAQAAYNDRRLPDGTLDCARLAVLADALQDAGCREATLLAHLRSAGPHYWGCWALDAVLGKG